MLKTHAEQSAGLVEDRHDVAVDVGSGRQAPVNATERPCSKGSYVGRPRVTSPEMDAGAP
jgi:hypothetical protein